MMNNLVKVNEREELVISSREIAEMLDKTHSDLLKEIDGRASGDGVGIIPVLNKIIKEKGNLSLSNYFIESEYVAGTRTYKEYLVTKRGCELIGNKQQGEKGIAFSILYVERFNEMEQQLMNLNKPSYMIDDEIERAKQWIREKEQTRQLEQEIKEIKPLYEFGSRIEASEDARDIGVISSILQQNGVKNIGKNRFMKWLRNEGFLISSGDRRNLPTQRSLQQKLMEVKTTPYADYEGKERLSHKALITPKGARYFLDKLLKEEDDE